MTLEEMIHVVDICSSNFRSLTSEEGKCVIAALSAGQVMHDTIDIFFDLEPSAERGCLATYCDLKKSKEAWDAATGKQDSL